MNGFGEKTQEREQDPNALAKAVLPENVANVVAGLLPAGVEPQGIDRAREDVDDQDQQELVKLIAKKYLEPVR